jgi:HlyD family secretion protein
MATLLRRTRVAQILLAGSVPVAIWLLVGSGPKPNAALGSTPPAAGARPAASLDQSNAEVRTFDITTIATGQLEAKNQIELRNRLETEAAIVEIAAEGTSVKKGDVLVKLNTDAVQQQIDQQLLELEQAKNTVAAARSALAIQQTENAALLRKAALAVDLAELDFQQWLQGEVETKRQKHRLDVQQAASEVDRLQQRIERTRTLRERGFVSAEELQKDEIALRKEQSALETARLAQRVYEDFQYPKEQKQKQSAIDEARSELEKTKQKSASELTSKTSALATAEQTLTLREARLAKLNEQKALGTITAPADGLVVYATTLRRNWWNNSGPLQIGRRVAPNELLIALPDPSTMVAAVKVPESLAGRIKPGQPATVVIDAIGGKSVSATVDSIGLLAEGDNWMDPNQREFRVSLVLGAESVGLGLRPSMRCESTIILERAEATLAVPVQAVFSEGPVRFVHVREGRQFARRPVQVARRSDRFAEITAGLAAGEPVLLRTPTASELSSAAWSEDQLAAVGITRNDRGELVAAQPPKPEAAAPAAAPATVAAPAGG